MYLVGNSLNATVAEALNQVALPVVDHDTCKKMDYWWFQVKTSMICCGYTLPDELKSVCQVKFCMTGPHDEDICKHQSISLDVPLLCVTLCREIQVVLWCVRMRWEVLGRFMA